VGIRVEARDEERQQRHAEATGNEVKKATLAHKVLNLQAKNQSFSKTPLDAPMT
jgi:hypothetical protein